MSKYKRPLIDILDELVTGIVANIEVLSVVANVDGTQTITACDIFYTQAGFEVTIDGVAYEITAFSQEDESLTLSGVGAISVGAIFPLYAVKFFHGTPITTQNETGKIVNADDKTPMIWLWENFKEKVFEDEIIERTASVELYALTQTYQTKLAQMVNDDIHLACVQPMRRLIECLMREIERRSDLFSSDFLEYETENFPKFGIIARNKGAVTAVFMDNLSGVAAYTTLELFYQEKCECPEVVDARQFDDSFNNSFA